MTPRSLSVFDLLKIPGASGVIQRNNKNEIDSLLLQLGFDVKLGYQMVHCLHRPLTSNKPVDGIRVEGWELMTPEWLASGNASVEARMESCTDYTLREELLKLNKTGCSDRSMTDEGVAKSVTKKEKRI